MLPGDGTCNIEIDQTILGPAMREIATTSELGDVTWELLDQCTFSKTSGGRGGVATGLGEPMTGLSSVSDNSRTSHTWLILKVIRVERSTHLDCR